MAPKTRKKKKNTAPKGVKASPTLDQPTTPFWNPSDLPSGNDIANWLNQQRSQWNYYGYQGTPTPTVDPYFTRWQQQQPANVPPAATAAPTTPTAAPTTPTNVGGGQSGLVPWVNPATGRVEMPPAGDGYAKNLTTGNVPVGNSYADWRAWNKQMETSDPNWSYYNPYTSQYAWQWNPKEPGTLMAGADPRSQEGVPWHEELNIPWSSSYAPEFYATQPRKPKGIKNRGAWRTKDTGIPVGWSPYKTQHMDANGKWQFERPETDRRTRMQKFLDEQNPSGNNTLKTIPAWVGPLVSWRT